ncbi:acyl-CoA thioesterase [bacterium]|nr:acyl-CoA thioesterase [bacterium]
MEEQQSGRVYTSNWRVTYRMSDQMGVVYYGNYFEMFEFGRTELLRGTGFSYAQMETDGFYLPVTRATAEYLAPARYDDLLEIQTVISRLDRLRIEFEYEIRRAGEPGLICRGATTHIFTSADGRPRRLNPQWLKRIQLLME